MSSSPYGSSDSKITRKEWEDLNLFFQTIDAPAQNELFASGDHYLLYRKLVDLWDFAHPAMPWAFTGWRNRSWQEGTKMMDKEGLLKLNCVPDGKAAWLNYRTFRKLQTLFEELAPPEEANGLEDERYMRMHDLLMDDAGIEVPESQAAVHLNAFILIRRGYKVEEITQSEYECLTELFEEAVEPDSEDMELHDYGAHRNLYNYLTEELGIYAEAGRGPVWFRTRQLAFAYENKSHLPEKAI